MKLTVELLMKLAPVITIAVSAAAAGAEFGAMAVIDGPAMVTADGLETKSPCCAVMLRIPGCVRADEGKMNVQMLPLIVAGKEVLSTLTVPGDSGFALLTLRVIWTLAEPAAIVAGVTEFITKARPTVKGAGPLRDPPGF